MTLLRALAYAVSFLTRIPAAAGRPSPAVAGLSVGFFPLAGLLLGAAAAGAHWLIREHFGFPPHVWWALTIVALHAFLTGALHLDGLADVADGLGAGKHGRDRALEIMRDSRIGTFGAVSLMLVLGAKVVVMDEMLRLDGAVPLLILWPAAARFAAVPVIAFLPYARESGLGRDFHGHSGWRAAVLASLILGGAVALAGPEGIRPAAAALGVAAVTGLFLRWRLGGLTGDGYGAAIELAELAFLAVAAFPGITG